MGVGAGRGGRLHAARAASAPDRLHRAHEVAVRDVARHDDAPLGVLAADLVGPRRLDDVRDVSERHRPAAGQADRRRPERLERLPRLRGQAHHDLDDPLAVQDLAHDATVQGGLQRRGEASGLQPELRRGVPAHADDELRHEDLRLHGHVHDPWDLDHRATRLLGGGAEHGQVGAEDLHGHLGSDARQHVVQPVADGLPHAHGDARET